jgi:hypothetical protein
MDQYVYELPPIDHWEAWCTEQQVMDRIDEDREGLWSVQNYETQFTIAKAAFVEAGWEGDGEWHLIALPYPVGEGADSHRYIIAVKQRNNGTTYVWSPEEMPWLKEYELARRAMARDLGEGLGLV